MNNVTTPAIYRCIDNLPYVFVSYSHENKDYVWNDIRELQKMGFNIWIDTSNLHHSQPTWEKAVEKIESALCSLVIFYAGRTSLQSEACYKEMITACSKGLDFIVIETEPIDSITAFYENICGNIKCSPRFSENETNARINIVNSFRKNVLPDDCKLRFKDLADRREYYKKLANEICNVKIPGVNSCITPFTESQLLTIAVNFINENRPDHAALIIENLIENNSFAGKAMKALTDMTALTECGASSEELMHRALESRLTYESNTEHYRGRSAALFYAAGCAGDGRGYYEAAIDLCIMGNKKYTLFCLKKAAECGVEGAAGFLSELTLCRSEDFTAFHNDVLKGNLKI